MDWSETLTKFHPNPHQYTWIEINPTTSKQSLNYSASHNGSDPFWHFDGPVENSWADGGHHHSYPCWGVRSIWCESNRTAISWRLPEVGVASRDGMATRRKTAKACGSRSHPIRCTTKTNDRRRLTTTGRPVRPPAGRRVLNFLDPSPSCCRVLPRWMMLPSLALLAHFTVISQILLLWWRGRLCTLL